MKATGRSTESDYVYVVRFDAEKDLVVVSVFFFFFSISPPLFPPFFPFFFDLCCGSR